MKTKQLKSSKATLISPIELAKLAALLSKGKRAVDALDEAMKLYVQAILFLRDQPSALDELVQEYGTLLQRITHDGKVTAALERNRRDWKDNTLEVDPATYDHDSPVRLFLEQHGLEIKTWGGLSKNFRRWHETPSLTLPAHLQIPTFLRQPSAREFIAQFRSQKDGRAIYAFPKNLLKRAAGLANWRRVETKRKSAETRKGRSRQKKSAVECSN